MRLHDINSINIHNIKINILFGLIVSFLFFFRLLLVAKKKGRKKRNVSRLIKFNPTTARGGEKGLNSRQKIGKTIKFDESGVEGAEGEGVKSAKTRKPTLSRAYGHDTLISARV